MPPTFSAGLGWKPTVMEPVLCSRGSGETETDEREQGDNDSAS